ncbi:MAG: TlpA disulfide reductase family protein [Planctomycetaceae bacterium]
MQKSFQTFLLLSLGLWMLTFSGCGQSDREGTGSAPPMTDGADYRIDPGLKPGTDHTDENDRDQPVTADQKSVTLEIVSFEELQQRIAAGRGRIIVCDYWSTSCGPCVKEFPHLVELSQRYGSGAKVACISASLDFEGLDPIEQCRATALEFLTDQKATFENVILSEDNLTVLDEKLKLPSIPIVEVYDTDGTLAQRFDESQGSFTYVNDVLPLIEELVTERFDQ